MKAHRSPNLAFPLRHCKKGKIGDLELNFFLSLGLRRYRLSFLRLNEFK